MDDDHTLSSKALLADTRTFLTENLRYQFPFMRTSSMIEAVEETLAALQQKVGEAKPQMTASKAGSSFFSLPAELRNYIYDLSFKPDDRGSYRVHFDECPDTMERTGCYREMPSSAMEMMEKRTHWCVGGGLLPLKMRLLESRGNVAKQRLSRQRAALRWRSS